MTQPSPSPRLIRGTLLQRNNHMGVIIDMEFPCAVMCPVNHDLGGSLSQTKNASSLLFVPSVTTPTLSPPSTVDESNVGEVYRKPKNASLILFVQSATAPTLTPPFAEDGSNLRSKIPTTKEHVSLKEYASNNAAD